MEICDNWVVELKAYIKSRSLSSTSAASQHLKIFAGHIKQIKVEYEKLSPKDFADSDDEDETVEQEKKTERQKTKLRRRRRNRKLWKS